jgi:hypothetical protein
MEIKSIHLRKRKKPLHQLIADKAAFYSQELPRKSSILSRITRNFQ